MGFPFFLKDKGQKESIESAQSTQLPDQTTITSNSGTIVNTNSSPTVESEMSEVEQSKPFSAFSFLKSLFGKNKPIAFDFSQDGTESRYSNIRPSNSSTSSTMSFFSIFDSSPTQFIKNITKYIISLLNSSSSFLAYKIAILDFFEQFLRIVFTLLTKLVFLLRDVLIKITSIMYSICLIPLDLILIVVHGTLLHVIYKILDKERTRFTDDINENEHSSISENNSSLKNKNESFVDRKKERRANRAARHEMELKNLSFTRQLFWKGQSISIRASFFNYFNLTKSMNEDELSEEEKQQGTKLARHEILPIIPHTSLELDIASNSQIESDSSKHSQKNHGNFIKIINPRTISYIVI